MRGILHNQQLSFPRNVDQRLHLARQTRDVDRQDHPGPAGDSASHTVGIEIEGSRIDVGEDRMCAEILDRFARRSERVRARDDLVAPPDPGHEERQVERGGAGV